MKENVELARSLIENSIDFGSHHGFVEIDGVVLTSDDLTNVLQKDPKSHPKWLDFAKEADKIRWKNGCSFPLSLESSIWFFILEDPRASKLGIKNVEEVFEDERALTDVLDQILDNPEFRSGLMSSAQYLLPDQSGSVGYLKHDVVAELIKSSRIESGILLDLGCGVGYNTVKWEDLTTLSVVGIDRQYHDKWYREYWKLPLQRTSFVRADFMAGFPFADDSISAIVMESVVDNLTPEGLARGLDEITRVLIPNRGLFIVGPEFGGALVNDWMVFKKERDPHTKNSTLIELCK